MIYLAAVTCAAIIFLSAVVFLLMRSMAQERREWASERAGLVNALTMGIPVTPSAERPSQQLEIVPDPDAAELALVGKIVPITDNDKGNDET